MTDPSQQINNGDLSTSNVSRLTTTPKIKKSKNTNTSISSSSKNGFSNNQTALVDFFD